MQGTEKWWASHIRVTAAHLERQGLKRVVELLGRTRGGSGNKLDWTPIQRTGRALAPQECKHYSFGVKRFCKPVRKILKDKIGYP